MGCTLPDSLSTPGKKVFSTFFRYVGFLLNRRKTEMWKKAVFLGLEGTSPGRENGMHLPIALPESKKTL